MTGPIIPYPDQLNEQLASFLFGCVRAEDDDLYLFDESDPVSNLWLSYGTLHGRFPRLEDVVFMANGPALHIFADGSVITERNGDVAYL